MATNGYEKGKLYSIPLTDLKADPDQPRKFFDPEALAELTASIKQHGILEPVLFRQDADGSLCIVAGERRCLAAGNAGLAEVPGVYVEGDHAEISLVENLLRADLTAVEEAEALDRIMKEHAYKQEDLARMIGKATSTISEILSVNRLPQAIRDECRSDPSISKKTLIDIAKSKQQRGMVTLYNKYKEKQTAKAQPHKKRGPKKTVAEAFVASVTGLTEMLGNMDTASLTDAEKGNILATASAFTQVVQEKLGAPLTPPAETKSRPAPETAERSRRSKKVSASSGT
jgi:ParB family transcriptional regulator, chromosome partitioning protein